MKTGAGMEAPAESDGFPWKGTVEETARTGGQAGIGPDTGQEADRLDTDKEADRLDTGKEAVRPGTGQAVTRLETGREIRLQLASETGALAVGA